MKISVYEKLKKITRPVFLLVDDETSIDRFRILYPDGKCEWMTSDNLWDQNFDESCFVYTIDLNLTVENMEIYDLKQNLTIEEVIEL